MSLLKCSATLTTNIASVYRHCQSLNDIRQAARGALLQLDVSQEIAAEASEHFAIVRERLRADFPSLRAAEHLADTLEGFTIWGLNTLGAEHPIEIDVARLRADAVENGFESLNEALAQWSDDDDFVEQLCEATNARSFVASLDAWSIDEDYPTTRYDAANPGAAAELDDDGLYEVYRVYESELYAAKLRACQTFGARLAASLRAQLPMNANSIDDASIHSWLESSLLASLPDCYCCEL